MQFNRIVLLAGDWETTAVAYHFLQEHFGVTKVVIEERASRKVLLKQRIKKMGWIEVTGQMLFQTLIGKALSFFSRQRVNEILENYSLYKKEIPVSELINVSSVNDGSCIDLLNALSPDLIVVHGTRIISEKVLQSISAPFINIHAGITPRYRGSHGAYWALYNNDPANCGVTVHLVDKGIDTGSILAQAIIPRTGKDNFSTYPYLQLAVGLKLLKEVIENFGKKEHPLVKNDLESALWHHPTIWGYLWKRIMKGVK